MSNNCRAIPKPGLRWPPCITPENQLPLQTRCPTIARTPRNTLPSQPDRAARDEGVPGIYRSVRNGEAGSPALFTRLQSGLFAQA